MEQQRQLDLQHWHRAEHLEFFLGFERPHFSLTAEVCVDALVRRVRAEGQPLFLATLWAVLSAVQRVQAFRLRFGWEPDGELRVWEHPRVHASFTSPTPEGAFRFVFSEYQDNFADFVGSSRSQLQATAGFGQRVRGEPRTDLVFVSCLPWLRFTSVDHAIGVVRTDCVPRIAWGKLAETAKGWTMPLNVQVHHGLVDGVDVAQLFEEVETRATEVAWLDPSP